MPEPQVTISSRLGYEGNRIKVRSDHVRMSNGVESTVDVVEGPDAVTIVAVDDEHNVLLVRQYRKAPERELLELPAGGLEPGEVALDAAQRELREETGHAAGRMVELGTFYSAPGLLTELMYVYLAHDLREDPLPSDEDEEIELERLPFDDAVAAARDGRLQDSKTLAALLLAAPHV